MKIKAIEQLEKKPLSKLKESELRVLSVCRIYKKKNVRNACMRGFFEGEAYAKERLRK